jgi:hypothetical protein
MRSHARAMGQGYPLTGPSPGANPPIYPLPFHWRPETCSQTFSPRAVDFFFSMYICIYTCMYIYIYTYIYMYTHTHTHTHTQHTHNTHTHTLVNMDIFTIVRTRTCYWSTSTCGNFEKKYKDEKIKNRPCHRPGGLRSHSHRSGVY